RGGVPPAGDQAAERPPGGGRRVGVDRLRVERPGKVQDLGLADRDRAVLVDGARRVVLAVAVPDRRREVAVAEGPGAPGRAWLRHGTPSWPMRPGPPLAHTL